MSVTAPVAPSAPSMLTDLPEAQITAPACGGSSDHDDAKQWVKLLREMSKRVESAHNVVNVRLDADERAHAGSVRIEEVIRMLCEARKILEGAVSCPCIMAKDPGIFLRASSYLNRAAVASTLADTTCMSVERRSEIAYAVRLHRDALLEALRCARAAKTSKTGFSGGIGVLMAYNEMDAEHLDILLQSLRMARRARKWQSTPVTPKLEVLVANSILRSPTPEQVRALLSTEARAA